MNKKKNLVLVSLSLVTLVLAGVAILTAWKLKQIGQQETKPTVPEQPRAQETELPPSGICYLAFDESPIPTGTPTPTPTTTETPSETPTPTGTLTPTPAPTNTPTPTNTPVPTGVPTPTNTPAPVVVVEQKLPEAGITSPTLIIGIIGLILLTLGIIF